MTGPEDRRSTPPPFGVEELRLPDELRGPFNRHLASLHEYYRQHGWGGSVGFGRRPAVVVIVLAPWWTDAGHDRRGSDLSPVVEATASVLEAAGRPTCPSSSRA